MTPMTQLNIQTAEFQEQIKIFDQSIKSGVSPLKEFEMNEHIQGVALNIVVNQMERSAQQNSEVEAARIQELKVNPIPPQFNPKNMDDEGKFAELDAPLSAQTKSMKNELKEVDRDHDNSRNIAYTPKQKLIKLVNRNDNGNADERSINMLSDRLVELYLEAYHHESCDNNSSNQKLNPVEYFTHFSFIVGPEKIKTAFGYLNKNNPVYEVGSGNGAVASFFELHGFKMTCIDPDPKSFGAKSKTIIKEPTYKYLKDVPEIEKKANLLIVAPDPCLDYAMEAIKYHKWEQIMIILDEFCCPEKLSNWLDHPPTYGIVYSNDIEVRWIDQEWMRYRVIVLEKKYRGKQVIENQNLKESPGFRRSGISDNAMRYVIESLINAQKMNHPND